MKDHKALQSILKYFEFKNDSLLIGGKTCKEIAEKIDTPFYAYDLSVAQKKIEMLRKALPSEIKIHYAIKANPHPKIIRFFKDHVDGFDVASSGELKAALEAGADASTIGFAGPGKQDFELEAACQAGIGSLNAESITELERADRIAGKNNFKLNTSLRVNPSYELAGSGMRMGGGAKQFGIDQEIIPDVLKQFSTWKNLNFIGFHIFAGSQNLNAENISASFEKAIESVVSFLPFCPENPVQVNLGGGFGIPYFKNDEELDIQTVGKRLKNCLERASEHVAKIEFSIELGRYLIGESGVYISRIIDKKTSREETFLIINGGMHHHLAASGNFGQVIKRNFPIILSEKKSTTNKTVNIVGPLCTPLDIIGRKVQMADADIGDLICVLSSGAYGYSASPVKFLSHASPMEIVISPN